MKVDAGTLMYLEKGALVRKAAAGLNPEVLKEPPIVKEKGGYSWQAIETKEPVVVLKLDTSRIASKIVAQENFASLVSVPMISRGVIIGVMSLFTKTEREFTQDDLNLFATIASQAASAVMTIRATELLAENNQKLKETATLNEISQSIATFFNFEETLFSTLGIIAHSFNVSMAFLGLFNHEDKLIHAVKPAFGFSDKQIFDLRTRNDEGVTGLAFCKGVPVLEDKVSRETQEIFERAGVKGIKTVLAAPLKIKSQTIGVLHLVSSEANVFQQKDIPFFKLLAAQTAVVVNSSMNYQAIEEERNKDEVLLSSIGDGVFAIDKNAEVIMFNGAAEKITGFLREEVLNKDYQDNLIFLDRTKKPYCESLLEIVKKSEKNQTIGDLYLKKRNGDMFPTIVSAAPIFDAAKQVSGSIIVFRDVTKEKEVEQLKQELISIATHELRTPITGMKGYIDMILGGDTGELNGETKEIITEMSAINQRLADLVDDLLNVGRIEQGRIEIRPEKVDLNEVIKETVKELSIQAEKKKLELTFEEGENFEIKTDPERIKQVLVNLIGNSIKYTKQGYVKVAVKKEADKISVSVTDSGIGMSKEQMSRLFEKFYRIKTVETRQITGTGLGLWITKKIVEMMGGEIKVTSELGKGSVFTFSLPLIY